MKITHISISVHICSSKTGLLGKEGVLKLLKHKEIHDIPLPTPFSKIILQKQKHPFSVRKQISYFSLSKAHSASKNKHKHCNGAAITRELQSIFQELHHIHKY